MNLRSRQHLLPRWAWLSFAVAIIVVDIIGVGVWRLAPAPQIFMTPAMMLACLGGVLGVRRAACNPCCNPAYRDWLRTTPWEPGRPLPFGPWHPVLKDLFVLAGLGLVAALHVYLVPIYGPAAATGALVGTVGAGLAPIVFFGVAWMTAGYLPLASNWGWSKYAIALWLACVIHVGIRLGPVVCVSTIGVSLVIAFVLVWRRMSQEVRELSIDSTGGGPVGIVGLISKIKLAGSPLAILAPKDAKVHAWRAVERWGTWPRALMGGVLLFAWCSLLNGDVVGSGEPWVAGLAPAMLDFMVIVVAAVVRTFMFGDGHSSHLSLEARWALRRLWVGEYDRVWIPAAMMVVFGVGAGAGLWLVGVPLNLAGAAAVATAFVTGVMAGPEHRVWRLTAPCAYDRNSPRRAAQ